MSTPKRTKPWGKMTAAELAGATKAFDDPEYVAPTVPMGPKQEAQLRAFEEASRQRRAALAARKRAERAAMRGPGRPQVGEGAERINIAIERGLLRQIDEFAKATGVTRSALLVEGVRQFMARDRRK